MKHRSGNKETASILADPDKDLSGCYTKYRHLLFDRGSDGQGLRIPEIKKIRSDLVANNIKFLLVANKIDTGKMELKGKFRDLDNIIFVSAKNGLHLETLKERMVDTVLQGQVQTESTIVTNARHFHVLQQLHSSLLDVKKGLTEKLPGDLLALDIRRCLHYLGEITGEITNEDQLDYIFSKFCIGK